MPPGRSQQIATCLNLMGDWRDSVRSQRSEKTDAVRVCRKTSGWTLCFDERGRNTWIATKCYCLLTQARQWVTAYQQFGGHTDRQFLAGQRLPPCRFERPLHNVHQSSNHERPVWSVEPPVSVNTRTAVPDPQQSVGLPKSGPSGSRLT